MPARNSRGAEARATRVHAIGLRRCGEGALEAAVRSLEAAVALVPGTTRYLRDLGVVYGALNRWADVLRVLTPTVGALDVDAQKAYLLAATHEKDAAAVEAFERAAGPTISGEPGLLYQYGCALIEALRPRDAEAALLACLERPGAPVRAYDALARLYTRTHQPDRALAHASTYARLRPESSYAQLQHAALLCTRGRQEEARVVRRRAIRLGIRDGQAWTSALHMALCDPREDGRSFARLSARALAHIEPRPRRAHRSLPGGRLRIGYLSPEFDEPPGSYFLNPFLLAHDRARFEVFLYDTRTGKARADSRRESLGDHVRDIGRLDDDAAADVIEADRIDVLVELSAHFTQSRVPVLARRPALVQATLPQCPATTGSRAVDYIFTDRWTSPPGTETEYVERPHYLSCGHVIYTPPAVTPPPRPLPAETNGYVTFGFLQRFMKLGPAVWDAIAGALRATPGSRLLFHNGDPEIARPESPTTAFLRQQLTDRGVDPARLDLVGARPHVEHLDVVSRIDVALDTWPYSGTTTTCECLWMGVPVVTLAGRSHAGRVSAAILRRMELDALVAKTPAGYARIATRLAGDLETLRGYRATLRDRFVAAGLTDGRALAAEMEAAYVQWVADATARSRPGRPRARGGSDGRSPSRRSAAAARSRRAAGRARSGG